MAVTKPYEFIGFGAMDVTKPYEFIWFGALDVAKPYEFIGFGALDVTKPYEFIGFRMPLFKLKMFQLALNRPVCGARVSKGPRVTEIDYFMLVGF